jgi:simple sugar transport system permease protein
MIRLERRLEQPRWLSFAVPGVSVAVAVAVSAILLGATGHDPLHTFRRLVDEAFLSTAALSATLTSATPLAFTGLAAAAAFRMRLFNIGAEGQLYAGAIASMAAGLALGGVSGPLAIFLMVVAGCAGGALWALIPGLLRAFLSTNEIIVSLMLNYVAGLVLSYLIFDSFSYWRDTSTPDAKVFPQGRVLQHDAIWPALHLGAITVPLGLLIGIGGAVGLAALYGRTRFGFEVRVLADSERAATYSGIRVKRSILAVMAISGAIAGLGGASQSGDFRYALDPRGLGQSGYGYAGIVVAALARYNPYLVVVLAFLLGGLQNAGYALQGADFPSGLVGVIQGVLLFCVLGGELFVRYRLRLVRGGPGAGAAAGAAASEPAGEARP